MGQLDRDPFMRRLADLAIARKRQLQSNALLAHDPLWRSGMAEVFGSPAERDEHIAGAPKARGILREPTPSRDVMNALKGTAS